MQKDKEIGLFRMGKKGLKLMLKLFAIFMLVFWQRNKYYCWLQTNYFTKIKSN